ncbi:MAG: hypothetical protein GF416_02730 [Candidatus Altiarchaeales archaeon]|nr:hypothetical protein [Candidatus Altiarchaeales archaeon]MBD3416035.1 hypothetical protein [Candidatus Altiarchaeales archaeon]
MKCPKDGCEMKEKTEDDIKVDECPECDGVWLDWGELQRATDNRVTEYEVNYRGKSGRNCPRCGNRMRKGDLHSVIVEECECGLFFDKGEIRQITIYS